MFHDWEILWSWRIGLTQLTHSSSVSLHELRLELNGGSFA